MRVVIIAGGARAEVAPYTGLAAALLAAGHRPVIATHTRFRGLVEDCGAEFRMLPALPRVRSGGPSPTRFAAASARHWRELGAAVVAAAVRADLLLLSSTGFAGYHVAEALGIPSMGAFLQPLEPTRAFPASVLAAGSPSGWGDRAATRALMVLSQVPFTAATGALRRDLGLEPMGPAAVFRRMEEQDWPTLYGFSPTVVPTPDDWSVNRRLTGYWWPHVPTGWHPPAELSAFLDAGPPPVYIGLDGADPDGGGPDAELSGVVGGALRRAGVRGVVQVGRDEPVHLVDGGGVDGGGVDGGRVLAVGEVPHEWLFPRMAAVVHHGGGTTTAAGMRAGVPAVTVPVADDQPFWAARAAALGTGPAPLPARRLDADLLAAAITSATTDPEHRVGAVRMAARLRQEDGPSTAVAAVERMAASWAPYRTAIRVGG